MLETPYQLSHPNICPIHPSAPPFYQLFSWGGSNHPINVYVPQLRYVSILVMVVLVTAAMVTRQVSTGGVNRVEALTSKWKEGEGQNRPSFIRSNSTVPTSGSRHSFFEMSEKAMQITRLFSACKDDSLSFGTKH